MGARFKGSFFSAYTSKEYELTIYDESGSFILKDVQLIDCAITYLNGADETSDPIMPAELRADLLIDNADLNTFVEDLAAASEGRFLVKLERDSMIEFLGYVLPDLSEIEDIPLEIGYKFTLKATDGLGRLKGVQYSLFDDTPYSGSSTFIDIILKCLNKNTELQSFYGTKADFLKTLVNWHAEQYTYSNTIDPLLNTRVPERAFYTRDKKGNYKFRTCYDVLKSICEAWNARMIYSLASFQFLQVSELANYTSRKFFTYTRTGTQGDVTESFSITHNQTSGTTDLMRISGGKFTFLPPLKYVLIDYKHIATENLGAGYEWDSSIGTNPQLLGEIDDQLGTARIFVNVLITYGATNFVTPPGVQGLWYVFNFTVQVDGSYLDRLISFVGGVPQPQSIGWSGSSTNGYQVALFMPTDQQDYFQTISFITPNIQSSGDFNFDVYLHSVYTSSGQLLTVPAADYYYSVGNTTIEHLYEGTLDGQSDIRRFIANNDTAGNSAFIEKETIVGDGIGVNSPGHLEVKNDTAAWVLADKWRIGNSGSYIPFSALKAQEIIRGQLTPVKKYNGTLFQKTDTLYRPNQVVLHSGTGTMVFMGGTFRLGVDEVDGTWFYIDLETTGWTNQAPIDYPEGEGADAGKPNFTEIDQDPPLLQIPPETNEQTFREEFTNVTTFLTVNANQGLIPSETEKLFVYQNGQLISPNFYYTLGGTIFLNYTANPEDVFTVVFLASSFISVDKSFRQEFTGITGVITVTANEGALPTLASEIYLYQNGQLIDPNLYYHIGSEIYLTYTPDVNDTFTVVFGKILTALKATEQIFREQFTGITNTLTVTVNNGAIPQNKEKVYIYQNGALISPEYYSIGGSDIILSYQAESWDSFTVIFGEVINSFAISRMYKQEFTGIINELLITVNNGILPLNLQKITVYQNGQLISESYYTVSGSTITLTYTAESSDSFTVIFWT